MDEVSAQTESQLLGDTPAPAPATVEESAAPRVERPAAAAQQRLAAAVQRHHALVWRTLRRFGVPERDVEDAAQHVFLAFVDEMNALGAGKEAAYLVAVAVRVAANARRKVQRSPEILGEDVESIPSPGTPEALLDEKQLRQELDRGLLTLPLEQRAVFVLYELEGFTLPEIAEALQIPLGTATSRLRRGRGAFEAWVANRSAEPQGRNTAGGES